MSFNLKTPQEVAQELAQRVRERRLERNWTQKSLAERSGVSLSVLKKFELTGKIALESLLKLSLALGALEDVQALFQPTKAQWSSLDALIETPHRKRGRV